MRLHDYPEMPSSISRASSPVASGMVAQAVAALPRGARPGSSWRLAATTLLRVSSKELDALASLFEAEASSDDRRLMILDLLGTAGTFEAQVVMRRVLAHGTARRESRVFAQMVQRLGFVERPDGPTLRFLMSVYAEARNESADVRAACAYALGAAAGNARAAGDVVDAHRTCDVLRRDLGTAAAAGETCALLTALGNAGLSSDATLILRFGEHTDGAVRAACALALRKMDVPAARSELVRLVADPDPRVSQSAMAALTDAQLGEDELERLSGLVLAGRTSLDLDGRILHLLAAQRGLSTDGPKNLEAAIRHLLGRMESRFDHGDATGSGARRALAPTQAFPMPSARAESIAPPAPRPLPFSAQYRMVSTPPPARYPDESGARAKLQR